VFSRTAALRPPLASEDGEITLEKGGRFVMEMNGQNRAIWIGVAIGAAVGLGFALSRGRKRDPWSSAKEAAGRVASRTSDISEATKDMVERIRTIYDESRKVVEDASELWAHGRKLVGV
jgi:hypothetical protein